MINYDNKHELLPEGENKFPAPMVERFTQVTEALLRLEGVLGQLEQTDINRRQTSDYGRPELSIPAQDITSQPNTQETSSTVTKKVAEQITEDEESARRLVEEAFEGLADVA